MPGPTPDFDVVTLKWAGVHLDGTPATGKLQLTYNGPVLLDNGPTPVGIYPVALQTLIGRQTIVETGRSFEVGYVEWQVPASNDPDIVGSGGTYTLTEILDRGKGRTFSFIADKDAVGGVIWLNLVAPSEPIPGMPYPAVSIADVLALDSRIDSLEASGAGGGGSSTVRVFRQETPLSSWSFEHNLGREPSTALIVNGFPVSAPTEVTTTHVYVTWPSPTAGTLILS